MPFGFVLFVTTHLSLQYENSIQTKFEVFVCYLPEVLNRQIFFLLLTVYSAFFFFSNELCATLALTFFLDGCSFPKLMKGLGFKCCMKITKQLCTSYKVFKGVENSEHCRTI